MRQTLNICAIGDKTSLHFCREMPVLHHSHTIQSLHSMMGCMVRVRLCALGARLTGRLFLFRSFFAVSSTLAHHFILFLFTFLYVRHREGRTGSNPLAKIERLCRIRRWAAITSSLNQFYLFYIFFLAPVDHHPDGNRKERNIQFRSSLLSSTTLALSLTPFPCWNTFSMGIFFFLRLFLVDWCMCASSTHSVYSYVYYGNDQRRFARMCLFFKSCFFPTAPSSLVRHNQAVVMCFPPHMNCTQNRFSFFFLSVFISHTKRGARQSRIGWVCTRRLMETATTTMTIQRTSKRYGKVRKWRWRRRRKSW